MKKLSNIASLLAFALVGRLGVAAATPRPTFHKPKMRGSRSVGARRGRKTTYFPPEKRNGERECARRRRQFVTGHARVSL